MRFASLAAKILGNLSGKRVNQDLAQSSGLRTTDLKIGNRKDPVEKGCINSRARSIRMENAAMT
jgi:hypothetical protein